MNIPELVANTEYMKNCTDPFNSDNVKHRIKEFSIGSEDVKTLSLNRAAVLRLRNAFGEPNKSIELLSTEKNEYTSDEPKSPFTIQHKFLKIDLSHPRRKIQSI